MSRKTKLIPVVVGILIKDDKLLVCQRPPDKPYAGYWEFPGGKIEASESGKEALSRELHEELGINVVNSLHLFNHTHTYPDKTVLLEIWKVSLFSGIPHGKEQQELRWVTFDEMLTLKLLEGNWSILEKVKSVVMEN